MTNLNIFKNIKKIVHYISCLVWYGGICSGGVEEKVMLAGLICGWSFMRERETERERERERERESK